VAWSKLEIAANDAAFRAHRSPVDRHSVRAGGKRHPPEATSSVLSKQLRNEVRRNVSKNCFSTSASEIFLFRRARDEIVGTFRRPRARQNRVHGDTGSGHGFREAARDGHLGGLGHAVGNHLTGTCWPIRWK